VTVDAHVADDFCPCRLFSLLRLVHAPFRKRLDVIRRRQRRVAERKPVAASVGSAWRRLAATDGRIALGSLASEMDCSHRTPIARFRTWMRFPRKTIARPLRFNRAIRSLDRLSRTRGTAPAGKPYGASHQGIPQLAGRTPEAFLRHMSFLK
jgi:hypothetical protein